MTDNHQAFSKHLFLLMAMIIFIGIAGFIASDMYAPALPIITLAFNTTPRIIQFTAAIYILSFSISQLFYGPLSDRFGRLPILKIGLIIYILGSALAFSAHNIEQFIAGRLVQGLGVGATFSLVRSMLRDIFSGEQLAKAVSYIALAFAVTPAVAPVIGAYMTDWFNWRSLFLFMLGYGFIAWLLVMYLLPETNKTPNKEGLQVKIILQNYATLLTHRPFMSYVITASMATSSLIVYYIMTPFLYQNVLGVTVIQNGWLTVAITGVILLSRGLNIYLARQVAVNQIIFYCSVLMLASAAVLLLLSLCGIFTIGSILIPMIFYILGSSLILPNAMAGSLKPFKHMSGTASALYGSAQMFGCFIATSVASSLHQDSALIFSLLMITMAAITFFTFFLFFQFFHLIIGILTHSRL